MTIITKWIILHNGSRHKMDHVVNRSAKNWISFLVTGFIQAGEIADGGKSLLWANVIPPSPPAVDQREIQAN
jgi:hypothetical protein